MVSVGGVIVDESDAPVEGVQVTLMFHDSHSRTQQAKSVTDTAGRWRTEIPQGLVQVAWQLQHPDFALTRVFSWISVTDELRAGSMRHIIRHGIRIRGVVVDETGAPVKDALIVRDHANIDNTAELRERVRSGQESNAVISDAEGRFAIPVEKKTTRLLTVYAENLAPQFLPIGTNEEEQRIIMGRGRNWSGVVKDASGAPLKGVRIRSYYWGDLPRGTRLSVRLYEAQTDADGTFAIAGLPDIGTVNFSASQKGFFGRRIAWCATAENESELTLYPSAPLQGSVVDAATGKPVTKYTIDFGFSKAAHSIESCHCHDPKQVTARSGAFSMETGASLDKTPGAVWVRVTSENHYPAFIDPVNAIEFATKPLEIRLEPAEPLSGVVYSPKGKGLKGVSVTLVLPDETALIQGPAINLQIVGSPYNTTTTGRGGRFGLTPSKDPGLIVALHETGWAVRPLAEHKKEKPLALSAWCRIAGTLPTAKRGPEEKAYVKAEVTKPETWNAGTSIRFSLGTEPNASGRFSFDYVPALPLKVGESRRWVMSHAVDVAPEPGKTAQVAFCGEHAGAAQGKLVVGDLAGPAEEATEPWHSNRRLFINARPHGIAPDDEYSHYVPIVQEDGVFALDCLPPGDYELRATLHALPPESACGRGTPVAKVERSFSIAPDQTAPAMLGDLPFEAIPQPQPGQAAAEIQGVTLDGKPWKLSDERGTPVLLVFWATWCAPCKAEIPLLKSLWQRYGESGRLQIIGLNLDKEMKRAAEFAESEKLPWPQRNIGAWSDTNANTVAYGVSGIPSVWLIDAAGNILDANIRADTLTSVLERHLP